MAELVYMSKTTTTETALAITAVTLGLRLPTDRRHHNFSNAVAYASNTAARTQNNAAATLFVRYRVLSTRHK